MRAPAAAIAERLSDRKDVATLIENKLPSLKCESDSDNGKIFLDEIVEGGGDVYAKFHDASKKYRLLIIMTKYQKIDLNLSRRRVFIKDTIFFTNSENFKVTIQSLKVELSFIFISFS